MLTTKPDGFDVLSEAGLGVDDYPEPHMALPKRLQPVEPIETEPGDLDDGNRSTEAGMGFVLALGSLALVAALATVVALWPADKPQAKAVAGVVK